MPEIAVATDPDPATSLVEPAETSGDVEFVSLSRSLDGTALTESGPETAPPAPATVTASSAAADAGLRFVDATLLNVRSGPSTGDGVVGQLSRGEVVTLVSSSDDGWSLVRVEGDGLEGWVSNDFLAAY